MQYLQFKDNILPGVSTILISIVVALILWYEIFIPGTLASGESVIVGDSPLAVFLSEHLQFNSWIGRLAAFACVLITGYCMVWLNETFSFINVRTILPAFFFLITASLLMRPHCFSTSWIITICIVFFVNTTFRLVEGSPDRFIIRAFDAGLLLSLATLFALQFVILCIPFFTLLYRCNSLKLKVILAFFTGILMPYFYCVLAAVGFNHMDTWTSYWNTWIVINGWPSMEGNMEHFAYICLIALLFIFSLLHFIHTRSHQNIRSREEVIFLTYSFFMTLIIILMNMGHAQIALPTCLFFCCFIIGQYFTLQWTILSKILLCLFFACSIIFYIQPHLF